ncbi:MAG: PQQ-binding-like beta-propeller repeat protein [Planctomycetota bacterium]|nr:PQQ-binding-like beta-propeller repeat protein [Planctomycetota bacterium]
MRFGKYAVVCVVVMLLSGCRPASPTDEWSSIVAPEVLAESSLRYYWKCRVNMEDDEAVRKIWRLDENIYALTSANRLIAIDAMRGTYKWSYPVAEASQRVFAPCHADNVIVPKTTGIAELVTPDPKNRLEPFNAVIINTISYAFMINRDTGKVVRKFDFEFVANTPGSSDGIHFYVASVEGWYHAIRLSEGLCQWTMSTGDMITATPKVFNDRLYVAGQDGKFYAINPNKAEDRHVWTQSTDAAISADFSVDERGCFVPSQDYRLYAYDNLTGTELWNFVTEGQLHDPVQVGLQTVFQYARRDRFYAIDLASGRERWKLPDGRTVLACAKIENQSYAMVLTAGGQLLLVHEILGKVEKSFPMTGLDLFVANTVKPVVYAAATDGKFVCITPESVKHLTPDMLKD